MHVMLNTSKYYSFCKQLGQSPSTNYAMSKKRGVKMGMEMTRSIVAPIFFILKLPVALAKAHGKIAMRQGCSTRVVSGRCKIAGTKAKRNITIFF
jgi:hypothetical protein